MTNTAQEVKETNIWAVVNQKGGVGKTTTAVNLATAMAALEYKVLLVDFDSQGNASTGVGVQNRENNIYKFLVSEDPNYEEYIQKTSVPFFDIIPAHPDLSGIDFEFFNHKNKFYILKDALKPLYAIYDYIFIDCPPSLGFLTVNALSAGNGILVPLQCEFYALEGLSQLLLTVDKIRENLNRNLKVSGIILTMFDQRNNLSKQVADDVRSCLGDLVFNTVIPRNIRLSEAPSHGVPALIYDMNCPGSQAYLRLAKEIHKNERVLA